MHALYRSSCIALSLEIDATLPTVWKERGTKNQQKIIPDPTGNRNSVTHPYPVILMIGLCWLLLRNYSNSM